MPEALSKAYNDISTLALRNARTTPRISTKRTKRTNKSVFSFNKKTEIALGFLFEIRIR